MKSVSALDFNLERVVEGSILTVIIIEVVVIIEVIMIVIVIIIVICVLVLVVQVNNTKNTELVHIFAYILVFLMSEEITICGSWD